MDIDPCTTAVANAAQTSCADPSSSRASVNQLALVFVAVLAVFIGSKAQAAPAGSGARTRLPTAAETVREKLKPLESSLKAREPIFLSGRDLSYDSKQNLLTITGDAKVTEGPTTLKADVITLKNRTLVHAIGNVHLTDPDSNIFADDGTLDLTTEEAVLTHAKVHALDQSYYLTGSKLQKTTGQNYQAEDATLTTCTCNSDSPDWSFKAKHIDLALNGEMKAQDGYFDILGHSVAPLPYLQYNTDPDRHSGFLSPQVGYSSLRGFYLLQPYFLDLAPNQDMTFAGDFESSARVGGLAEYRRVDSDEDFVQFTMSYYNESFRTNANRLSDTVDDQIADTNIPVNRWGIVGLMEEHLTPSLFAYGTATSASDSLFFREMSNVVLSSRYGLNGGNWQTTRNADSDLGLFQEFEDSFIQLKSVWNQDLIQPQRYALQTLPSLSWSGYQGVGNGFGYLTYNTSAVNYWRQDGVDGSRFDVNPQFTIPWLWSRYLNGWATAGFDYAAYDVSGRKVNVIPVGTKGRIYNNNLTLGPSEQEGLMDRIVPDVDVGVRTTLLGKSDLSWLGLGQATDLIVPTLEYTYVPTVNQNRFPLFDETDRINARSLIFYGFSSRLFIQSGNVNPNAGNNGYNVARGKVGPSFSTASGFTEEVLRLSVQEAYDTSYAIAPDGSRLSDVAVGGTVFPNRVISGVTAVDWSPRAQERLDSASFGVQFQPPGQKLPTVYSGKESIGSYVQLSYAYAAPNAVLQEPSSSTNAISMATLRAYLNVSDYMGLYFAPDYDLAASRLLTDIIGVRLKSACDCWFIDVGFDQTYNPNNTSVTLQVTLGGLGSIGEAPFGLNPFQSAGLLPQQTGRMPQIPPMQPEPGTP
ncbi:MAG: LPS assembly protein LptD [Candidatus Binataceae bacterium]